MNKKNAVTPYILLAGDLRKMVLYQLTISCYVVYGVAYRTWYSWNCGKAQGTSLWFWQLYDVVNNWHVVVVMYNDMFRMLPKWLMCCSRITFTSSKPISEVETRAPMFTIQFMREKAYLQLKPTCILGYGSDRTPETCWWIVFAFGHLNNATFIVNSPIYKLTQLKMAGL